MLLTVEGGKRTLGRDMMLHTVQGVVGRDVILQTVQRGKVSMGRDDVTDSARGKVSVGRDVMLQILQVGKGSKGVT